MIFFASQPRSGGSMVEIGSGFQSSSEGKRQTMWKSGFGRKTAKTRSNQYLLHSVRPEIFFLNKVFTRTVILAVSSTRGDVRTSLAPG